MARNRNDRPNIIVFFTDQQRADTTGIHGNPLELTPNFDRLAAHGTHVPLGFTCQPVCGPARSCIQTGLYATESGCFNNRRPLPQEGTKLAEHFRDAGYRTGYIGKWHLAGENPVPEHKRAGYDYWLAANSVEGTSEPYAAVLWDNDNNRVELPGYRVDALTDAAIRYIDASKEDPFFLFLSFLEPHHQNHLDDYVAPDGYKERYTGRWTPPDLASLTGTAPQHLGGYYGMVKRLDEALGRIQDAIKSRDLAEDTIILFTADHGCHFKTRNAQYKQSCHESSIHVPFALTGPGFTGGGRVSELVSLIDVPPTLLDAAGIPIPPEMQGRSVLSLVNRTSTAWPQEVFVQISGTQVARAIRTKRWKYSIWAPDKDGGRDSCSDRYIEEFLYDLQADPYELTNLVGMESYTEVSAVLREKLLRRMASAGEAVPFVELAPQKPSGQRRVAQAELQQ